jgi:hypothetical protein
MISLDSNVIQYNWQNRLKFIPEQDHFLCDLISKYQPDNKETTAWRFIKLEFNSKYSKTNRTVKQLKNHYNNVLNQKLNRLSFSKNEEMQLIDLYHEHGRHYRKIAEIMGRTVNSVKNHCMKHLKNIQPINEVNKTQQQSKLNLPNNSPGEEWKVLFDENLFFSESEM